MIPVCCRLSACALDSEWDAGPRETTVGEIIFLEIFFQPFGLETGLLYDPCGTPILSNGNGCRKNGGNVLSTEYQNTTHFNNHLQNILCISAIYMYAF